MSVGPKLDFLYTGRIEIRGRERERFIEKNIVIMGWYNSNHSSQLLPLLKSFPEKTDSYCFLPNTHLMASSMTTLHNEMVRCLHGELRVV